METEKIVGKLHKLERSVLPLLDRFSSFDDLVANSGLKDVEVMRALQWLQNKGIIALDETSRNVVELDVNGKEYLKNGLPERRLLEAVKEKEIPLSQIEDKTGLSRQEVSVALGSLRQKAAVILKKEKELYVSIMEQGRKLLEKGFLEDQFLRKTFPVDIESLQPEEIFSIEGLKKRRGIVKIIEIKDRSAALTELGKRVIGSGIPIGDSFERLTRDMIRDGSWKEKSFRAYDVAINVPAISGGRKQHYRKFLDDVRRKFISLGFTEMFGSIIESEFWDMDALFMPQFHSARDIHSAYYLKEPRQAVLDNSIVKRVKDAHETGGSAGSKGWGYKFDLEKTKRLILRTQGTALSARMLASKDLKIPGKYFGIARCFRPDVIDATHNVDFYQTEGIVVDENLNFQHLRGLLKTFAEEFCGTGQIKIVPAYFPFTEPSAELFAKHPELGWIELGGSGIFRPEVVGPLAGKDVSVLAWGLGIDRIGMFNLGIKDIRNLFSHDLKFLKGIKVL